MQKLYVINGAYNWQTFVAKPANHWGEIDFCF